MSAVSTFREELENAVNDRHCAKHPMSQKWAAGELSRHCLMGIAVEGYHWVSNVYPAFFLIAAKAPKDVVEMEIGNFQEETDPANPHPELFLRFAGAAGADVAAVRNGRGLPSTELWLQWELTVAKEQSWEAAVAAIHVGSEFQSTGLYQDKLSILVEKYGFTEHEIEHFTLHSGVDIEHSSRAFEALQRYCDTREKKERAIHFAGESARFRWFYFDGIYLHYEMNYRLV